MQFKDLDSLKFMQFKDLWFPMKFENLDTRNISVEPGLFMQYEDFNSRHTFL